MWVAQPGVIVSFAPALEDSHPNLVVVAILSPRGTYDSVAAIVPSAFFANLGPGAATFRAVFRIDSGAAHTVFYNEDSLVTLGQSSSASVGFPEWPGLHPYGEYSALCSVFCAQDTHHVDDTLRRGFQVAPAWIRPWQRRADLPHGTRNKNVKDGGALATTTSWYVYALKGNNTYEFYRYNVYGNSWVTQDSIPAYNRNLKKKGVNRGSSLVRARDYNLYATRGNNTLDFWQFDPDKPEGSRWTQMTDVPAGARPCREGTSMASVRAGGRNYVYLLKGSGTPEFYRYDIKSEVWDTSLPPAPAGTSGRPCKNGSSITYDGGDTIWCLKGSYNEFFAYSITGNNWVTREALPWTAPGGTRKTKVKDGSGIAATGRVVYALKGGNTNEFWRYECDSHGWSAAEEMPTVARKVKGGGALVCLTPDSLFYALRGNNTRELWSYEPGAGSLQFEPPGRVKNVQANAACAVPRASLSVSPNPATYSLNPSIYYSLPVPGNVSLKLYDITGKLVCVLASGRQSAGRHSIRISDLGVGASRLGSGIYLLEFKASEYRSTEKIVIE